ncbi:GYF domain-containing protein [Oceaniferula spumae]
MAEWFYGKDNTQHGPVSDLEVRTLISTGQIDASTIIWREGMTDWLPLKDVSEFQNAGLATGAADGTANPYNSPQTNVGQPQPYVGTIPTDTLAIVSLVCGILAVVVCYLWALFGIPAVICGHMSLKKINNSATPIAGKGMAIAGLVTGYIGIALQLLMIIGVIAAIATSPGTSYP